jgi:CheY-like chemotaxis protein
MDREQFAALVRDALGHLRNRFYLGKHPLARELSPDSIPLSGDALRELLLSRVEELKPVGGEGPQDADWRRYRHLVLRYAEGQGLEQVASALGVSVRQATRDHHQAVETLTELLWSSCATPGASPPGQPRLDGIEWSAIGAQPDELTEEIAHVAGAGEGRADLAETVEGVVATLGELARESRVTFRPFVADALPALAVSPTLLRQSILNLLLYAVEVAPGAEIQLAGTDTARGVTLRILARRVNSGASPPSVAIEPSADTRELLAVADRLLGAQGATLEVGGGEVAEPLATLVLPPVPLRTIMVVDDNPELIGLFRRYLRDQPYRVIQATSGATALKLGAQLAPAAIVLDVMMPGQDGWEVLRQIRGQPETRDVPIVMCSVLPEQALARALGVREYLTKPVSRPALLAALARCDRAATGHPAPS